MKEAPDNIVRLHPEVEATFGGYLQEFNKNLGTLQNFYHKYSDAELNKIPIEQRPTMQEVGDVRMRIVTLPRQCEALLDKMHKEANTENQKVLAQQARAKWETLKQTNTRILHDIKYGTHTGIEE